MKINVFLPCRKKSSRVKNKNTRKFADINFGLLEIKLGQLLRSKLINKIYISTNDKRIINYCKKLNTDKIIIHERIDRSLSSNQCSNNQLVNHAIKIMPDEHILWTHVTSPFVDSKIYDQIIKKYINILKRRSADSLMTITKYFGFFWLDNKPLNYKSTKLQWPRTQDTKPLDHINSAVFISSKKNYIKFNNRIGKKVFLYNLKRFEGLDIDESEDFYFAEYVFKNKKRFLKK